MIQRLEARGWWILGTTVQYHNVSLCYANGAWSVVQVSILKSSGSEIIFIDSSSSSGNRLYYSEEASNQ